MDKKEDTGTCRSCNSPIIWTKTTNGKKMPVDLEPSPNGDFYLFRRERFIESVHRQSRHKSIDAAVQRGDKTFTSHFATCANVEEHRR